MTWVCVIGYGFMALCTLYLHVWCMSHLFWLINCVSIPFLCIVWYPTLSLIINYTCGVSVSPDAWFWNKDKRSLVYFSSFAFYLVVMASIGSAYCASRDCEQDPKRPKDALMLLMVGCYGEQVYWIYHFLDYFKADSMQVPEDELYPFRSLEEAAFPLNRDLVRVVYQYGDGAPEKQYRTFSTFTTSAAD